MIIKIGDGLIIDCKPVNIFRDEKSLGKNLKSVSYSMVFQDLNKNLRDEIIEPFIKK